MRIAALALVAVLSLPAFADDAPAPPPTTPPARAEPGGLDAALVNKLTPEQLTDVLKAKEESRRNKSTSIENVLVPIGLFGFLALIIIGWLLAGMQWNRLRHETMQKMVEKGMPIPKELLVLPSRAQADMRRGFILIATGVGASAFLGLFAPPKGLWSVGLIPILIGLAYLLSWRVTKEAKPLDAGK